MSSSNKNTAFSDSIPSLFVIASPLQVICAIEAINKFKIKEYRIILLLSGDQRDSQTLKLCNENNLVYEIESPVHYKYVYKVFKPNFSGYNRCFIGDPRSIGQYFYAYRNTRNGGSFVFLDDGDDTIFLLKGYKFLHDNLYSRIVERIYKAAAIFRGFNIGNNLFTIYGNINNPNYNIVTNDFSFFASKTEHGISESGVYFVGTNHSKFCEPGNYPLDTVKAGLYNILKKIKMEHPRDNVYYIPHGRDNHQFPHVYCNQLGIEFIKPDKTVELFFIENKIFPKAVYGFTSTALYNIKLLFPNTFIYNVVFDVMNTSLFIEQTNVISEYYKEQNIKEIRI